MEGQKRTSLDKIRDLHKDHGLRAYYGSFALIAISFIPRFVITYTPAYGNVSIILGITALVVATITHLRIFSRTHNILLKVRHGKTTEGELDTTVTLMRKIEVALFKLFVAISIVGSLFSACALGGL